MARDFIYAVRTLAKNPGFTFVAIATLAIGIGANTAIFSVANAVLLEPLRVPNADRVVRFLTIVDGRQNSITGAQQFDYWRRQSEVFEDVAAHRLEFVNVTGAGAAEHIPIGRITMDFFPLFGASFAQGRGFTPDEDRPGALKVAVLSHGFWSRRFGGDPAIVGKIVLLGGVPHEVVGILGPGFDSEQFDVRPDAWVPFQYQIERIDGGDLCIVTGRLKEGVTLEQANARVAAADAGFLAYRSRLTGRPSGPGSSPSSRVEPLMDVMVGGIRSPLTLLMGAVGLVLLIACANVANLLLARAAGRRREIAIRTALGASRGRIVRQLLTESVTLSMAGSVLGLALGVAGIRLMLTMFPRPNPMVLGSNVGGIPRIGESVSAISVDWRVLSFVLMLTVITTLLFGLLPALLSSRSKPNRALREAASASSTGGRQGRLRGVLVVSELALALTLLVGAGLLIRTFQSYLSVETGFNPENVITMRMAVSGTRFDTRAGIERLSREAGEGVRAIPGVIAVSAACCMPLETVWQLPFVVQSRPTDSLTRAGNLAFHGFAGWTFVSPGYFDVLRISVLRGRDLDDRDTAGAPGVVLINETMARLFWKSGDPLNDRIAVGRGMRPEYAGDPVRQIVGIVRDVRTQGLTRNPRPEMYVPVAQMPDGVTALNVRLLPIVWIARTQNRSQALSTLISREIEQVSGLSVARTRWMTDVVAESTGRTRFDMWLMMVFAGTALLLATIGVYGLTAHSVQIRTQEIGIRMALGGTASQVRRILFGQALGVIAAGIIVGSVAAFFLTRLMAGLLFGVTAHDPIVFVAVAGLLAVVAVAAVWFPARRATNIDPLTALRSQ